ILQQHYQRKTRSIRVNQTGWYGKTYVLPDRVIGVDKVVFATSEVAARFGTSGTLKEWQYNVIKYAAGNSVPLFCLSLGYGAITMGMCSYSVQNLAVNIMGGTSQGKTVSEKVSVSMIGPPNYLIQLSGTARSLRDMPRLHNHSLVIMDDISKLGDEGPKFAKEFSFDFEGGQQRSRLKTTGEQRHRDE
ncbi:MAG TPA: DUF927 domain-containing protein, partial [Saprospiraceae bacterium]|nr:DUF927 domain-containing protein [Saprospiraceae bacterium]